MSEEKKTKGLLDNALNILSSRDEKAALEAAKTQIADLEKHVADLEAALTKSKSEAAAALDKVSGLEQQVAQMALKARLYDEEQARKKASSAATAAEAANIIEMHTMADDETLSHLALKYYGHATKPYWNLIYEANKDAIGPNPNKVRVGTVLKIPVLPSDMKK